MNIYKDNSYSIGRTPLVQLNKIAKNSKATILAKIEGRNPAYSVKCRIGANMIWDAEKRGILNPAKTIVEPTSGNTGIALAFTGAARGYQVILTMPESASIERRKVMKALGAQLILTPAEDGMKGAIAKAQEILNNDPTRYIFLNQFENPANPAIHESTTGPEIWQDTDGNIDIFVAGVGTGGTFSGVSRFFKSKKAVKTIAVEPTTSPVITQTLNGESLQPGSHKIQGIGAGFVPHNLDLDLVDAVEQVSSEKAIEYSQRLAREEGILSGISCGAAAAAAVKIGAREENSGKTIVTILPDAGERYLSTPLFEGLFDPQTGA
ncbi:MAG: cysteine synthase A [candidate division KSB1 bacterium]|nr:cysteine synthase A [candidate division KSB1 bacterium]